MFESKKDVIAVRREKDTPEVTPIRMCKGRHGQLAGASFTSFYTRIWEIKT